MWMLEEKWGTNMCMSFVSLHSINCSGKWVLRAGSTENLSSPLFKASPAISGVHMIGTPFNVDILTSNILFGRLNVITKCKREVHTCVPRTGHMALKTERDCNPADVASCNTTIMLFFLWNLLYVKGVKNMVNFVFL